MANEKIVKITKRENINSLLAREDLTENEREFLVHELELLDKKNAYKASKNAEKNAENDVIKTHIFSVISNSDEPMTLSTIALKVSELMGKSVSPQKVRPQITKLIDDGVVENYKEKGISIFRVVG